MSVLSLIPLFLRILCAGLEGWATRQVITLQKLALDIFEEEKKMRRKSKTKFITYAVKILMAMPMLCLIGCNNVQPYAQPRQGDYLYLNAGESYTPTTREKWISPALLQKKDEQILMLTTTINQMSSKELINK